MKKFFTLCLMFLVAGVLNLSAGYVLSGENVNGEKWNHSSAKNTFTEDENGDLVLEGVSLSGKFLVCLDQSKYFKPVYGAKLSAGVPLVFTTNDSADGEAAASYTNCTIKLTKLSATAVAVEIVSTDTQDVELTQLGENWSLIGDFNGWSDLELTQKSYGVYEAWIDQATVNGLVGKGFKFRVDSDWSKGEFGSTGLSYGLNQWNILQRSGGDITTFVQPTETYDKYLLTFCVEGSAAKFRIDGYKQATPKSTKVTIDLTAQGYVNAQEISSVSDSSKAITVAFNKGTNSNSPKYYESGNAVRVYGGGYVTITAPEGETITSIQFAYGSGDGSNEIIADCGSFTSPTWTGAANSVKFTIDGTKGNRRFAQIYVTYGEANPEWAPKFNDVANGGVYYNSVQYNIAAPGAEKMDIVMNKNGANYWSTSTTYNPWYNGADVGEWEIIATAFKGNEFTTTTASFIVEEASAVYSLNEFIGTTGKKYYKFNNLYVLAQGGQNLYVKDDTRSILIYGNSPKFKVGDCLQELVAEYKDYNGQHELIAYQFGQVCGNYPQQPEVISIEDVTVANQSKYVKIENVALNAEAKTIGGVTFSNRFNTELPDDGNYTVTAIIGMSQGTPRLEPITFEEYQIEPFTYTEIVPADKAEVTSLSEIKITFPYNVTYDAEVGVLVMDGGKTITPTVAVESNVATLTFDAITAYGSKPSLMVMAGAFKASGVGCQQIVANWSIPTPPIVPTYVPTGFNPADGSEVEKIGTILIYTDDAYPELSYNAYDDASKCVTVYDAQGNVVEGLNQLLDYASVSGGYAVKYMPNKTAGITEPGTYTFKFAEGTFGDETYYEKNHKKGRVNPEFTITYTIKAAALAAPTVSPANGAEIESPSTITLTFAEAVTVNAEAGELTMVNTSDPNYDKAKNFNVTISEDGLTATITSEPGYLDRWATNATYKLNIPAGYFVGASGAASEALEYSWTIAAPKFTYVAVDPAQGEVTELSEILISFAQRIWGYGSNPTLNLVDADGNVVTTASTVRSTDANGNWFAIKATLKDKVTTPGTYTLVVPENSFTDVDFGDSGNKNAAFDLTWTVMEPDPNTYNFAWNVNPAEGTVEELKTIVFTAATAGQMLMPTDEAQTANWVKVTDQNGNVYNTTAKAGTGYDVTIEGATAPGTYTVVVPKASFYDLMASMSNPNSKNFNDEIVLTYTLQEEEEVDNTVYDYAPVTVSPANGSEVESLEKIYVSFPYGVYDCLWAAKEYNKDFIQVSDENGNTYEAKIGYGSYTEDYYIYVKDATAPGKYTIVVPKGLVFDEEHSETFASGHANPEFTLTYTLVAPVVEDFTPVVNPTAGNVTVDQIKTTVLSFESPIASFDDEDVRYIKPIGNVWCSIAGSYTISEDKLSLTINWDFAPEVGLNYTLELPAGCIVLENGAKNLLTQVAYTVVAGPKDLAEFVVPAGMNGYVNYDETDVNAWAPEFPFTVSTTAYNTVAFAAELPSLPAGITAMEVIDENGEVIAILNQDGVAPLADGEIYYVKGETTKEYVDGAELKFRFRFTHLGVSETIQFSYIVAGGNITSIADVELDGNVIVRGNDIIAPEGAAIFTVSGIRVPAEGLAPGVYVVVLGNQAVKVMVK